jgi:hypothetical protein
VTAPPEVAVRSGSHTAPTESPTEPLDVGPPRWLDLAALTVPALMAAVGTVGLLLAILGVYTTWAALALGVPVAAVMLIGARRVLPSGPAGSWRTVQGAAAIGAVAISAGYLVFAGSVPSQNVVATRDPGLYMNTARWISQEGTLAAEARVPAFSGISRLRFSGAGVYDVGDGRLEFQFNHLASVVLAVGHDLGGYRLLFRMPALASAAGLLALYAVTVRVTRRPVVSLLAPALLAVSLPVLYASRNTYSEPFAMALLWGAGLALADLHRRPRLTMGLLGGLMLGALVSTRVDALLYVALLFPFAALSLMSPADPGERPRRAAAWLATIITVAVTSTVGFIDLLEWTGYYASDLGRQLRLLRLAVVGSAGLSLAALIVWRQVPALGRWYDRVRGPVAVLAPAGVVALLVSGWLLRPRLQVARGRSVYEVVRNIQLQNGLAEDPTRTYAENSLRWMGWYLGKPALVAAIVGLALVTHLAVRRRAGAAAVGVLGLTLAAGALYWWNPSITPDHLWATRRFVPAVLPGLAVMATAAVAMLAASRRFGARSRRGLVAAAALLLLVPPATTTWPLRWQRAQYGYLNTVREACGLLPPDAAVVVLGGFAQATMQHTLRSWCGVPVAGQGDAVAADQVSEVAGQVRRNGYRLALVSMDAGDLATYRPHTRSEPRSTNSARDAWLPRSTLDRAPDSYVPPERALPVQYPFRLHVLPIDVE